MIKLLTFVIGIALASALVTASSSFAQNSSFPILFSKKNIAKNNACPTCTANAFYISPTGNDANAGTVTAPFATLAQAQTAMRASGTKKTVYIRGGNYTPAILAATCGGSGRKCAIYLTASDNAEVWSYYPPDGYCSASISGSSTAEGTGGTVFYIEFTQTLQFNGLSIHNFDFSGIDGGGSQNNITVKNNCVYNGFNNTGGNPGGITCYGCVTSTFNHNIVHDIQRVGISLGNVNGDISNFVIDSNYVYNVCLGTDDCGAIYETDVNLGTATGGQITNNYVWNGAMHTNIFGASPVHSGSAIYLDDCVSGTTVSGNVVTGRNGGNTLHLHGGKNNHFINNIIDLFSYKQLILAIQTSGGAGCNTGVPANMIGNQFENNIIIGQGGGGGFLTLSGTPPNAVTITNNDYWNYAGSAISSSGSCTPSCTDASPQAIYPWLYGCGGPLPPYLMNSTSAVRQAPVSFPSLARGWGYPGFVVPLACPQASYL